MCWSSVTCSRLVSYAHWPLGKGKALMFRDFLQLKSSAELETVAVKCTVWNLSLANIQAFLFFFSPLVSTCEDAERWSKTPLPIPSRSYFSYLLNSCGWPLSVWCQLCSDEICPCSIWIYSNILQICAWKVCFVWLLGFFPPTLSPFLWKCSLQGPTYLQRRSPLPHAGSVKFLAAETRAWFKPQWSQVSTGFDQTFGALGRVGQASHSLATPQSHFSVLPVAMQGTLSLIFYCFFF